MSGVPPSGTVTLLFTDIEGSTRLWDAHPVAMRDALARHDVSVRAAVEAAGGYVFKTVGDAFCVAFATATDGLRGAIAAQRAVTAETWPEAVEIRIRMALHSGECTERDGDYFGPPVNRVARLEATAHGGQIVMSGTTASLLAGRLDADVCLRDLGEHRLKDLSAPEHVFQIDVDGLTAEFPALRSLTNPALPNNLPRFASILIGREHELAAIRGLVEANRLVTLTGTGGAGKTRLAVQIAAELLDGSGDGVWLVELAAVTDPARVPAAVAGVLGVRDAPTEGLVEVLVEALGDRRVLIVLDNCEHVIDAVAKLTEMLLRACPGVELVATSREPMGVDGERVYRVPSLSVPDAVGLFVERARAQRPGFEVDADTAEIVTAIVRRLDGIPLALELAAARLRSLSVGEIAERLDQRFRLLTTGGRTAVARQQTLRAAIDWSYDLLGEAERRVLCRSTVFLGDFDLAAAEAVLGDDAADGGEIVDLVDRLVDKSLIQHDTTSTGSRYRLLESLREYARERLAESGIESVSELDRAHAEYFLALAETAAPHLRGPDQVAWLDRLDADHDNLRAALAASLEDTDPTTALRLVVALREFWDRRAHQADAESLGPLLDRTSASTSLHARARACAAMMAFARGDYALSRTYAEAALAASIDSADDETAADALAALALNLLIQGHLDPAMQTVDEALVYARSSGNRHILATVVNLRGWVSSTAGRHAEADVCFHQALAMGRASADKYREAISLLNIANEHVAQGGDLVVVRQEYEDVLARLRNLRAHGAVAHTEWCLGSVLIELGDARSARPYFVQSLSYARRSGDRSHLAFTVFGFALLATGLDELETAAVLHGAADALLSDLGHAFDDIEGPLRDRDHARLRAVLGDASFDAGFARGRLLTRDEAIALAFDLPG